MNRDDGSTHVATRKPGHRVCQAAWLVLVGICTTATFAAESWSRFRGPEGNGISRSANLRVSWSSNDFQWKAPLPGKGHSSPVVWGDRVFVTSGDDANADRFIVSVSRSDGKVAWRKQYESRKYPHNRENSYGSATPAVDETGVYITWTTPDAITVLGLSLDGKQEWIRNLGPFIGKHGSGASPVVLNGLVWINNDQDGPSSLVALDAATGDVRHRIDRLADKASYGTPCVLSRPGRPAELIFAASGHGLTSVDPATGKVNWDFTNLFPARVVSSPITSDGLVICSSGEGGVGRRLVAVRPPLGNDGPALVYDSRRDIPNVPTPLAKDGRLFLLCDNGMLRCLRTATGEPLWQERLPARFYASPVWAENRLYLTSKTGDVFVIAAADTYQLLAQNSLGEPGFATPAIAGDTMLFRTESSLIAIGPKRESP